MNESANEEPLTEVAKELFDESVEHIDAATLSRLNQGRHKALQELARPGSKVHLGLWAPATGVAVAAVLAVLVMRGPQGLDEIKDTVNASDFEMLLEAESLEMYENLEFYSLLDELGTEFGADVG